MPWWLLGISMVATTFSTDTPNLVTDLVRQQGVAGNWAWWAFLLTGMVTVFVYARLWRRSGVLTDISFYELRYGGKSAAFLRGFRALYLGLVFNVLVMATVSLAAIKLGSILLGWPGWLTLLLQHHPCLQRPWWIAGGDSDRFRAIRAGHGGLGLGGMVDFGVA